MKIYKHCFGTVTPEDEEFLKSTIADLDYRGQIKAHSLLYS